jgi:hypothetical protein
LTLRPVRAYTERREALRSPAPDGPRWSVLAEVVVGRSANLGSAGTLLPGRILV